MAWRKRLYDERQSWIAAHPQEAKWTLLHEVDTSYVLCRCQCGIEKPVRYSELKSGKSTRCQPCASRDRMQQLMQENPEKWQAHFNNAAARRVETNISKYNEAEREITLIMIGAKQRCCSSNNLAYERYGGRGIKFLFDSIEEPPGGFLPIWGKRPLKHYSIDRVDNDRHYSRVTCGGLLPLNKIETSGRTCERKKGSV